MGGQMGAGSKAPCPRLAPWAPCVSHGAFCGPGGKAAGPGAGLPGVENLFSAPGSPAGARKAGIASQSRPFAQGGVGGAVHPPPFLPVPLVLCAIVAQAAVALSTFVAQGLSAKAAHVHGTRIAPLSAHHAFRHLEITSRYRQYPPGECFYAPDYSNSSRSES